LELKKSDGFFLKKSLLKYSATLHMQKDNHDRIV